MLNLMLIPSLSITFTLHMFIKDEEATVNRQSSRILGNMDSDSRRKLNLQGVLKYAVEHTNPKICDSPQNEPEETDTEKKAFLQNALKAMTMDVTSDLKNALAVLQSPESDLDQKIDSLETIRDNIDDIDLANSFVKMDGTTTLLRYINGSESKLKTLSMHIVAEMAQNNPFCQNTFLQENYLPILVPYMRDEDSDIARSSIYAVSSIIRNFNPGLNKFIQLNGLNTLFSCLRSTDTNVYIKAAFLIGSLSSAEKTIRDHYVKELVFGELFHNLKCLKDFDAKQETTLFALSALSVDCKWKMPSQLRLESESILKEIRTKNQSEDACQDSVNSINTILENQFTNVK